MESENESRPLLRTLSRTTKRSIFKRIPSEVAITGVILTLFLTVVTLLLLLENLGSDDSKEELTLDSNLLASPLKYNKKASFNTRLDEDSRKSEKSIMRNWIDEWRNSYNVENFGDSLNKRVAAEKGLFAYLMSSKDDPESKLLQKNLLDQFEDFPENYASTVETILVILSDKTKKSPYKYTKTSKKKKDDTKSSNEQSTKKDDTKHSNEHSTKKDKDKGSDEDFQSIGNFLEFLKKRLEAEEKILGSWNKFKDSFKKPSTENEILENLLQDPSGNVAFGDTNLLGSPFKYNKKAYDLSWQNKKDFNNFVKYYNDKWNNAGKDWSKVPGADLFDQYMKSPELLSDPEINLLGSPYKYNKKVFGKQYPESGFNEYKWDNVDKGWKKFYPLGSTSKKENIDENLSIGNSPTEVENGDMKQGMINNNWNKVSEKGDKNLKEFEEFNECWKSAENQQKKDKKKKKNTNNGLEKDIRISVNAPTRCPFSYYENNLMQSQATSEIQVNCALLAEQVRRDLGKCIDLSFLPKECKPVWRTKCFSTYKYRKIDGSCNNQIHPTWGKSGTPYVRMMAPEYGDGVSSIRSSKNGGKLPNARFLSHNLYSKKLKPDTDVTLLFLYFGLLVDHDMVETAINRESLQCCNEKFVLYPEQRPKECLEVPVAEDDPFYGPRNVKCLNVVRSMPVHGECVGRREQLNSATSLLDGSAIYGSTIQKMKSLRSFSKGLLRSQIINSKPYMSVLESYGCGTPSQPYKCFDAGDSRINMLLDLTVMHTLWHREHNKLAEELHKINPKWTDETLFQEARKILIAELQHITYAEFLPLLLGNEAMDFFQLSIVDGIYYDGYDDTIDPSVFNVFASAAFRFGHSLVQIMSVNTHHVSITGNPRTRRSTDMTKLLVIVDRKWRFEDLIDLVGPDNKTEAQVPLHETYFNPQILYHKGLDSLIRGSLIQQTHSVDSSISKEVREHLFQSADKDFGNDLSAIGIQRGRDHGIPGYTKWRLACGLPEIKSWEDLKSIMNVERAEKLKEVYELVEDIDLIPGALAEDHVEGSLLGPTHLCIIGRQFKKTRKGDRLWFEIQDQMGSFTADQLKEIYNSNMARIICDNSDGIQMLQKYPFKSASIKNPVMNCEDIPKIDLSKWKSIY